MKKQTKSWLDAARDDLLVIEEIQENDLLTHMVAFHAHQAIEKSFKAVLEEKDSVVPRIHDLITLQTAVEKYVPIDINMDVLKQVNELYIDARYPSDLGLLPNEKPPVQVSKRMYDLARKIHREISHNLA